MTEQAKLPAAELAKMRERDGIAWRADRGFIEQAIVDHGSDIPWPFTAAVVDRRLLLAEVERLQGEVRRLREALEQYANERLWHHRDQWIGRGRGWDLAQEALADKEGQG